MTETRTPYHTNAQPIAYPGSKLELLVEALCNLEEFAPPEAYSLALAGIHVELTEALHGRRNAKQMLLALLEAK